MQDVRTRLVVVLIAAAAGAGLLLSGLTAAGIVVLGVIADRQVAAIGGCPSNLFPIAPGSRQREYSEITVNATTGCWETYDEPSTATPAEVFGYYQEPSHTAGWTLNEEYADTGYAAFTNTLDPTIRVDVGVSALPALLIAGPRRVQLAISICRCDPRTMAQ